MKNIKKNVLKNLIQSKIIQKLSETFYLVSPCSFRLYFRVGFRKVLKEKTLKGVVFIF